MPTFWTLFTICITFKLASTECVSRQEFHETLNELKALKNELTSLKENELKTLKEELASLKENELKTLKEELASLKENASRNSVHSYIPESEDQKRFVADTVSENVAFSVLLNKRDLNGLGGGQTVMFDTVLSNHGNAFDQRLSVFTAKTTGWYVFSLTIMTSPSDISQFHVVNNGAEIFHVYSEGNEYNSASKTVVTRLNAGDEVWVKTSPTGTDSIHGYGHTSFTGWLQYFDEV